jgi:hypothetical protein
MSSWSRFECRALTQGPKHHFFGYYDKFPYDVSGRFVLGLEADFMDHPPQPEDKARIGLVDLTGSGKFETVAETTAWNWQQGTHLQWLPGGSEQRIIYNVRDGDRYVACIHDLADGDRQLLPLPIYAVSRDGRQAVTLNFSRLHADRPGYGYNGIPDPWAAEIHPDDDGIYRMDLVTGEHELVVSLAQVAAIEPHPSTEGGRHRFNHLQFSTDDQRFVFLHRWQYSGVKVLTWARIRKALKFWALKGAARNLRQMGGLRSHHTRMYTAAPDGSDLYLLNQHLMTSHFDWRDGNHILAWARRDDIGDRYFLFTDQSSEISIVGEQVFDGDGHCSYSPDRRFMLTDTYPRGPQHLRTIMLFNLATGERTDLGGYYSPPDLQGEIRCDLHPRWSRDGHKVCFDSMHEGHRQIYEMDVTEIVGS